MTQPYLQEFASFSANGGGAGPAWLRDVRQTAIGRFAALGFPTPKNEDWHFTSVQPIAERSFRLLEGAAGTVTASDVAPFTFGHPEWPTLVFVNGRFRPELSDASALPPGVRVLDLARAAQEAPELLERWLTRIAGYEAHSFTALNTAFMRDGAVVHFGRDVAAGDVPVHLLFVSDARAADGVAHLRNLIIAERFATGSVIESWVSLGGTSYFTNAVTEVALEDGATLHHVKVQRESRQAFHVGTVEAHQARDSHFLSFSFTTGGALARTNVYTTLDGDGCGATLNGLYMGNGEQHLDQQTRIEHAKPNCFSREVYKGILDDASHGVFNGKVYVQPIAQKTDGKQENKNLLLSDRARVDTKPQLEIFADDVKCTHGATVGRPDEQALFYLKSRGVGDATARKLLTYAFAADVLETIATEAVREQLEALTLERFA